MKSLSKTICYLLLALAAAFITTGQAQTTALTYQGQLNDGTTAANGTYQMQFSLYDAAAGGTQAGTTITDPAVTGQNGIFTVRLNFTTGTPSAAGAPRYLEIAVKKPADAAYTTLAPRQQITSSPYAIRTLNAQAADTLSAACAGCVTDAQIASVAGSKITGTVANAANVTGTVAVANGGTGSTTKNFVDLTTAQTAGGNKTFSNTVAAGTFSAGSGGLNMNSSFLRLRDSTNGNHGMLYNSTVDGPEFRAAGGFRWTNGTNGATERMKLDGSGNLSVTGTITGTLADNSVTGAQVADGSLRLTDISIVGSASNLGSFPINAHACAGFNLVLTSGTTAIGDILYVYPVNTSPPGIYIQPTVTTSLTTHPFYICNSLNTTYNFPAQSLRVFFMRP